MLLLYLRWSEKSLNPDLTEQTFSLFFYNCAIDYFPQWDLKEDKDHMVDGYSGYIAQVSAHSRKWTFSSPFLEWQPM